MRIKPRFTKNKGSDVLRFSVAGLAFIALFSMYWNRASIPLSDVETGYQAFVLQGETQKGHIISEDGVAVLRHWLEKKSSPTLNPITIVWHNINYRNNPSRYELVIGLRGIKGERKFREYGIYQRGRTVYLQIEPIGSDRVLRTSFTADELEKAISSYIEGKFETVQTNRTDDSRNPSPDCSFKDAIDQSFTVQFLRDPTTFSTSLFSSIHPPSHRQRGAVYRNKCR